MQLRKFETALMHVHFVQYVKICIKKIVFCFRLKQNLQVNQLKIDQL